jgi:type IV pilus assembly protein PilB
VAEFASRRLAIVDPILRSKVANIILMVMRISDSLVIELLKKSGRVNEQQLNSLIEQQHTEKNPLQEVVLKNNTLTEKELTQLYAQIIDVPFIELDPKHVRKEVLKLIPEHIARQYNAVVFDLRGDGVRLLAMEDPDDVQAYNFLQKQLGVNIKVYIATRSNILSVVDLYRGNIGNELTEVIASEDADEPTDEEVSEEDVAEDSPIAQTVNLLIDYAIKQGASDIHIEPREDHVSIRYRIDGQLKETNRLPKKVLQALVSRIKILSNLKIDERRAPQDGRFKVNLGAYQYALRVSTLPIADGEKVVMRILNESTKAQSLQELGFWGESLHRLEHAITRPHGLILFTGPTGSGKSTSLFSILSRLNQPNVNISTIEDPVEYKIQGANQVQVNPVAGMTFVSGLRALLRQDPNIIMVGEIRDSETANLAVQAALTGHLVFSTLHTNNAATCLPRLLEMEIEPFLIASTVRAVVGQRLVRKLVPEVAQSYNVDDVSLQRIKSAFDLNDQDDMRWIHGLELEAIKDNIGQSVAGSNEISNKEPSSTENGISKLWHASNVAANAAFHGRLGIYEVLTMNEEIQKLVTKGETSEIIQDAAIKEGMVSMQTDGFIKSLRGQTTLEEVMRVTTEK